MGELPVTVEACAQCAKTLTPDDRVASGGKVFCRSCYATLRQELHGAVAAMSTDVNWAGAITGAVLGGIAGTLVWWGFTVLTNIAFGLIAVAIGFLVGHGVVRFSGGKRTTGLQVLAIGCRSSASSPPSTSST
jgi:outer membrane lipoprotein SlyB